jgi:hypothetical protein
MFSIASESLARGPLRRPAVAAFDRRELLRIDGLAYDNVHSAETEEIVANYRSCRASSKLKSHAHKRFRLPRPAGLMREVRALECVALGIKVVVKVFSGGVIGAVRNPTPLGE